MSHREGKGSVINSIILCQHLLALCLCTWWCLLLSRFQPCQRPRTELDLLIECMWSRKDSFRHIDIAEEFYTIDKPTGQTLSDWQWGQVNTCWLKFTQRMAKLTQCTMRYVMAIDILETNCAYLLLLLLWKNWFFCYFFQFLLKEFKQKSMN